MGGLLGISIFVMHINMVKHTSQLMLMSRQICVHADPGGVPAKSQLILIQTHRIVNDTKEMGVLLGVGIFCFTCNARKYGYEKYKKMWAFCCDIPADNGLDRSGATSGLCTHVKTIGSTRVQPAKSGLNSALSLIRQLCGSIEASGRFIVGCSDHKHAQHTASAADTLPTIIARTHAELGWTGVRPRLIGLTTPAIRATLPIVGVLLWVSRICIRRGAIDKSVANTCPECIAGKTRRLLAIRPSAVSISPDYHPDGDGLRRPSTSAGRRFVDIVAPFVSAPHTLVDRSGRSVPPASPTLSPP